MSERKISWRQIEKLCTDIGRQVNFQRSASYPGEGGNGAHHIVGLARGGLIPATMLSNYLGVRTVISHGYHSYDEGARIRDYRNPHGTMYQDGVYDLRKGLMGSNILIVDDLCDEGVTMAGMVDRLKSKFHEGVINIKTAALFCKNKSVFVPDYVGEHCSNDEWLVFPWEAISSFPS